MSLVSGIADRKYKKSYEQCFIDIVKPDNCHGSTRRNKKKRLGRYLINTDDSSEKGFLTVHVLLVISVILKCEPPNLLNISYGYFTRATFDSLIYDWHLHFEKNVFSCRHA